MELICKGRGRPVAGASLTTKVQPAPLIAYLPHSDPAKVGAPPLAMPLANWACGCQPEIKASINRLVDLAPMPTTTRTQAAGSSARSQKVRSNEHKDLLSAGACFPCKWADTMRALLV